MKKCFLETNPPTHGTIKQRLENMKLSELKQKLDRMSKDELKQDLLFMSKEYSISGVVKSAVKSNANLFNAYEDDPCPLYTRKQLKENGHDKEEIESFDIEIPKGAFVINLD